MIKRTILLEIFKLFDLIGDSYYSLNFIRLLLKLLIQEIS